LNEEDGLILDQLSIDRESMTKEVLK